MVMKLILLITVFLSIGTFGSEDGENSPNKNPKEDKLCSILYKALQVKPTEINNPFKSFCSYSRRLTTQFDTEEKKQSINFYHASEAKNIEIVNCLLNAFEEKDE